VSSWTFCHLIDPLATLETWSNALAVGGALYLNDIDFSVAFEGECAGLTFTRPGGREALDPDGCCQDAEEGERRGDATGDHPVPRGRDQSAGDGLAFWERDPETRMRRAFEALHAKGDGAFSVEFAYDEEDYRTAVKVTRLSVAPIRFAPMVGYCRGRDADSGAPILDRAGRSVYSMSGVVPVHPGPAFVIRD